MAGKPASPLYLNRFFTGLVTQRNPLTTPFSFVGLNMIQRHDALLDGLNVEISPNHTLQRRPGYPRYCSQVLGTEIALAFGSARMNNAVYSLLTRLLGFALSQRAPSTPSGPKRVVQARRSGSRKHLDCKRPVLDTPVPQYKTSI